MSIYDDYILYIQKQHYWNIFLGYYIPLNSSHQNRDFAFNIQTYSNSDRTQVDSWEHSLVFEYALSASIIGFFGSKPFQTSGGDNVTVKAPLSATLKKRRHKIFKKNAKKRRIRSDSRFEGQDRNMYSSDVFSSVAYLPEHLHGLLYKAGDLFITTYPRKPERNPKSFVNCSLILFFVPVSPFPTFSILRELFRLRRFYFQTSRAKITNLTYSSAVQISGMDIVCVSSICKLIFYCVVNILPNAIRTRNNAELSIVLACVPFLLWRLSYV